jgi:MFS family permease
MRSNRLWLITAVALGVLLNPLNTTMISVAFSRLQEEFHVDYNSISWLIASYYVASAVTQPVMGKLGDLFGRKRMFILGLVMITIASLLAPLSPSIEWLMAFRIIQAIGNSAIYPSGMGMIRNVITENQARTLSILSIFSSTSAALGPSLGGYLIHYSDWQSIFLVNFPIILISFILAVRVMPKDKAPERMSLGMLDMWGIGFFTVIILNWLFFFLSFEGHVNFWLLGTGLAFSVLFYKYESKQKQPFIDVLFLKQNLNVCSVYVQFIFVNVVAYSIMFSIPSYLQQVRHFDAKMVGTIMLSVAGFGIFVTPLVGRWIDRSSSKWPLITGTLILIAGALLMLLIHDDTAPYIIFAILSVFGISSGFHNLGLQTALYTYVSKAETGIASGLFMTSRFMGTILSSSLLGAIFSHAITTQRLHILAWACAAMSVVIFVLAVRMPNRQHQMQNTKFTD